MPKLTKTSEEGGNNKKKAVRQEASSVVLKELGQRAKTFFENKSEIKTLEDKNKEIRSVLEEKLVDLGCVDSKGNQSLRVSCEKEDYLLKYTNRTTNILIPEAVERIKEMGFEKELLETTVVVRTDILESMAKAGKITAGQLQSLYIGKTSKAFSVEKMK